MDEADKYQQRLQAIAEKRRLQEEQDRAKRELEDERLRLQQLKRKSLRDQWLMEGPPQSPTSPDGQCPRSPLWGSQAQEIENRIDKLQTESQRLAEEEEKLKEQMEDDQTETVKVEEAIADAVQEAAVVQNGLEEATSSGAVEDGVNGLDGTAAVLTNGRGEGEGEANHNASEENTPPSTNGLIEAADSTVSMTFLDYTEAEPGQVPNTMTDEEEGTLVMRAERIIITDEGDDGPDGFPPQGEVGEMEDTPQVISETPKEGGETVVDEEEEEIKTEMVPETSTELDEEKQSDKLLSSETPKEGGETVEEEIKAEMVPETSTELDEEKQSDKQLSSETPKEGGETVEVEDTKAEILPETSMELNKEKESQKPSPLSPTTETHTATGEGGMGEEVKMDEDVSEEIKAKGQKSEPPASEQLQSPDDAPDGATVASVPVYPEAQPSALSPRPEAEGEVEAGEVPAEAEQPGGEAVSAPDNQTPGGAEVALEAQVPDTLPGQFQEVSLADPQENQRTEGEPGEQEPLLSPLKASQPEPAAAIVPTTTTEIHTPTRAAQGGEALAPKRKTCQCCSVM